VNDCSGSLSGACSSTTRRSYDGSEGPHVVLGFQQSHGECHRVYVSKNLLMSRMQSCLLLLCAGFVFLAIALHAVAYNTGSSKTSLKLGFGAVHAEMQGRMKLYHGLSPWLYHPSPLTDGMNW
jgi:hypothetical protein